MEKIVRQTLLYDFYGELLNDHQRKVYEDAVLGDMSLSEIAEELGITRQGVHDMLRRCDKQMEEYEGKLHLLERFLKLRGQAEEIRALSTQAIESREEASLLIRIRKLSEEMLESL